MIKKTNKIKLLQKNGKKLSKKKFLFQKIIEERNKKNIFLYFKKLEKSKLEKTSTNKKSFKLKKSKF